MVQQLGQILIKKAVVSQAQDIYLIPKVDAYEVYLRLGDRRQLLEVFEFSAIESLISHFKFVAGMNVGEKRRSQLGSCDYDYGGGQVALRLSSVGDYRGFESLVIRLLHDGQRELKFWFNGLGDIAEQIKERGLYLFSGPVGSGKTSLMYELVKNKYNQDQIITIEDPVEIKQDNMLQLQLNEAIGMTYNNLIKLSLRHRPDILIIGEIRDQETARAVVRASLTGATVFSTVHAKSIPGVYDRLLELGISEQELDNCLKGIAYQRLIKGGGLVDFAKSEFQKHSAQTWNNQITQLFTEGYITEAEADREKIIS